MSVFYAAGPPEAQLCGASRVGVRWRQLGRAGRRLAGSGRGTRDAASPTRRSTGNDVGLPRPRPRALWRRRAQPNRDRRPSRKGRAARGGHAQGGQRLSLSVLFLFLGALPCTEWLQGAVAGEDGFILTGAAADAGSLLATSLPGVFAAGDVRSGSTKRCATTVGEGAMAVQFVHALLANRRDWSRAPEERTPGRRRRLRDIGELDEDLVQVGLDRSIPTRDLSFAA